MQWGWTPPNTLMKVQGVETPDSISMMVQISTVDTKRYPEKPARLFVPNASICERSGKEHPTYATAPVGYSELPSFNPYASSTDIPNYASYTSTPGPSAGYSVPTGYGGAAASTPYGGAAATTPYGGYGGYGGYPTSNSNITVLDDDDEDDD